MKILAVNGPNLALLGKREPDVYGSVSLDDIMKELVTRGSKHGVDVEVVQSAEAGALVNRIGNCAGVVGGIIINPAA